MDKTKLIEALRNEGYEDIRYEEMNNVSINVKERDVKEVSIVKKNGGHARALCGGGWGTFSFNNVNDCNYAIEESIKASRLMPGSKSLAKVPVVKDIIKVKTDMDPRNISIDGKKELLLKYCNMIMDYEGISNVEGSYYENFSKKYIVNNEGTDIEQEQLICGMKFSITSKRDGLTQQTRLSLGGTESFKGMMNQEIAVMEKAKQTVELLSAKPVIGGVYDVVLDSNVAGVFIHEAFGHLSESDGLLGNEELKKTMTLGTVFGNDILNVIDDPSLTGNPGSYIYDDEGVKGTRTYLIKNGTLCGRLHSRETAGELKEVPTGHARAMNYSFTPLVRMGNIYIDKGTSTFEEMIASIDNGLYLFGAAGGQTSGEMFTFAVQGGYVIRNGKICDMVRDIALTGNLFTTLKNIDMIGNSLQFSRVGGCGKNGQMMAASGKGSPVIKIKSMGIGGR